GVSVAPSDGERGSLTEALVDDRAALLTGRADPPADRPPGRAVMILLRSRSGSAARFSAEGSDRMNTPSSTTDTISDSAPSWLAAGACTYEARLGRTRAAVASTINTVEV